VDVKWYGPQGSMRWMDELDERRVIHFSALLSGLCLQRGFYVLLLWASNIMRVEGLEVWPALCFFCTSGGLGIRNGLGKLGTKLACPI